MAFLFYLLLIVTILIILFVFSEVKMQVLDLQYNYISLKPDIFMNIPKKKEKKLEYLIEIKIYLFGKIPFITFKINKNTLKKLQKTKFFSNFEEKLKKRIDIIEVKIIENMNNMKKDIVKNIINFIKELDIQVVQINLDMKIGFEDVILTTFTIPFLSTIFSLILREKINNLHGSKYKIMPIYNLNNSTSKIDISFKGIFKIKMRQIITLIYLLKSKKKEEKNLKIAEKKICDYSYK